MDEHKRTGRVRWFNSEKGFGFITEDGAREDIFLHFSAIQTPSFKNLREGQRVLFDRQMGARGPVACDVIPIFDAHEGDASPGPSPVATTDGPGPKTEP